MCTGGATILDNEDIGTLERPASMIVGRLTVGNKLAIDTSILRRPLQ